ncbi:MAG: TraB/GumN family protein [Planctomycetaceae bacterium]|nr:TraB/GumN family protein [Planctomycetaceae bacterium]
MRGRLEHFLTFSLNDLMKQYFFAFVLCLFSVLLFADHAKGEHAFSDFLRISKPEGQRTPVSYDTAIAKFTDEKNNAEVHLIGVIHIGDKEYYAELNEIFKQYDAVLYELVADEDTRPSLGTDRSEPQSILSSFQSGMGNALALDFQLNHIDYHAANMIHADLSPAEFARRASERGDMMQMFYRALLSGLKKSGPDAQREEMRLQGRLLGSLLAADPKLSLKRVLAEEMMNQLDDAAWIIGGEGSAIISDRNEAALNVLRRELANGKKKIAIFYGAAHLPEFANSLERDFQMQKTGSDWVIAWDLTRDRSARR